MNPLLSLASILAFLHAKDQDRIADNLVGEMALLWNQVDFTRLDQTTLTWAPAAAKLMERAYLQSQRVAAVYSANTRFANLATDPALPIIVPDVELPDGVPAQRFTMPETAPSNLEPLTLTPPDVADFERGLLTEGNVDIKRAMPILDPQKAMDNALVNTTGSGVVKSMNGGRNAASHTIMRDRKVIGYARYTDGNPCYFCAMLAARGAVYKKGSFANGGRVNYNRASQGLTKSDSDFVPNETAIDVPDNYVRIAKVHNHCRCTLRPVFFKSQSYDEEALFYKAQWDAIYSRGAGEDNVNAFRQSYVPFQRREADVTDIGAMLQERETALLNAGFSPASPQVQWATTASNLLAI